MIVADHALAFADAAASLGGAVRVRASTVGAASAEPIDVIVLEQTIEPASPERLAQLAGVASGAPIVTAVAEGAGRYRWMRIRQAGSLFQIEATGFGSLAEAVREATAPEPAIGQRTPQLLAL
ncbi:MAG: hypothetical protein U0838_11805 [Chloroflexota bacterium]